MADNVGRFQLYNLARDPEEMHDLYGSDEPAAAEAREQMKAKLIEKLLQNVDTLPSMPRDRGFGDVIAVDPRNYFHAGPQ